MNAMNDKKRPSPNGKNNDDQPDINDRMPANPSAHTVALLRQYARCCLVVPKLNQPLSVLTLN